MARDVDIGFPMVEEPITVEEARYPEVEAFTDLPFPEEFLGEIFVVATTTGVIFVNRRRAGLYSSDGVNWDRLGTIPIAGEAAGYLPSNPPTGKCIITNMYYDPSLGMVTIEKESIPKS